jgi:biofilm PGA synthesis lipoprotein PgaB
MKRLTVFGLLCLLALQPARAEVIALCYHDVTATTEEALKDETAVSVSRLVGQFNWLLSHGYTPISLKQLLDSRAGDASLPPNPVLLTFDDGYRSFYDKVLPLLELYEFPAVLAPVTSWVDAGADRPILYGDTLVPRGSDPGDRRLRPGGDRLPQPRPASRHRRKPPGQHPARRHFPGLRPEHGPL